METAVNIDPQLIRQMRETRAWSQEHLAEVSGLSTRTIQRLETTGLASAESRRALASAFGLTPAELALQSDASFVSSPPTRSMLRSFVIYLLVCGSLLIADAVQHGTITWSKWPLLGWGAALLIRFLLLNLPPGKAPAGSPRT